MGRAGAGTAPAEVTGRDLSPLPRARELLGALVVATCATGQVVVRLVEVEAYGGADDPASHAYRGPTARNASMFGPPGTAYVYASYGLHWCLNVVCGAPGTPAAVLLRAGQVLSGVELARSRRPAARRDRDLARGPGRLAAALGVDRSDDGRDLSDPASPLQVVRGPAVDQRRVSFGPRVGVGAAAERPWRVWIAGEECVSTYRPGRMRTR
ncbi:MAG: DNA-3-methyladenine glycosylase [Actinomycetes bacterium]